MAFPGPRSFSTAFTANFDFVLSQNWTAKEVSCESEGKADVELLHSLHDINEP
jgi:hypothetical protein